MKAILQLATNPCELRNKNPFNQIMYTQFSMVLSQYYLEGRKRWALVPHKIKKS